MINQQNYIEYLTKNILIRLGNEENPVELSQDSLKKCIDLSISVAKQKSDIFFEDAYLFLTLLENQHEYILPDEVSEIFKIYRRGFGRYGGNGDVFDLAVFNSYFLRPTASMGGLTSYDFHKQYLKQAGKMFGEHLLFKWEEYNHTLTIMENPKKDKETVILHAYKMRPIDAMVHDKYAGKWIEDWAYAEALELLGKARSRFGNSIAGPSGSVSQNGSELINEGKELKEKLLKEIANLIPGGSRTAGSIIIGYHG